MRETNDFIGYATIDKDGTLSIELRAASGIVEHRTFFQIKPGQTDYQHYLEHIGQEMIPGHRYGFLTLPKSPE